MKKLLLIAAVLINNVVNAQQLTGSECVGVEFGDSRETIQTKMQSKIGFNLFLVEKDVVSYTDGMFAEQNCFGVVFHLYDNQTHTIIFLISPQSEIELLNIYSEIVSGIKNKYAIEPVVNHRYLYPYYEGDEFTIYAIKNGYASLNSRFDFSDGNTILVSISRELSIRVSYQHYDLSRLASKEQDKKQAEDY